MTTTLVLLTLFLATTVAAATSYPTGKRLRALVYRSDPCLAQIIDRETGGTWNPRIYNGFTYWHPGDPPRARSYGLPQAQPPEKMASAGADWRTNPFTQLAWMRSYTTARYGSACAALAFWLRHRWY